MSKRKSTAGLALFRRASYAQALLNPGTSTEPQILLVHPTGARPFRTWSIPKGHLEPGESKRQAALRETREEVGIIVPGHQLQGKPGRLYRKNSKRSLYYWIINVSDWHLGDSVPFDRLQIEEIDIAKFVPLSQANKYLVPKQIPLLRSVAKAAGVL